MERGDPSSIDKNIHEEDHGDLLGVEQLPPGFRFHPTDEEIIMHYLLMKVIDKRFMARAIGEADFNKCEPWDLPKKAKMGEKEWFFFCQRDRKYPTGMRTNRATESGYWKATGKDKEIYKPKKCLVGMKKTLVFYQGRAPKGEKSNWVMHEYRMEGNNFSTYNFSRAAKESWVVCKVFHKNIAMNKSVEIARMDSFMDHLLESPTFPPLADSSSFHQRPSSSFAAEHEYELKSNIALNYYKQEMQHDQKNFIVPNPQNFDPNPMFFSHVAHDLAGFPYQACHYQDGAGYPTNPFKGVDQMNSRFLAPNIAKKENFSSSSAVSQSQDTGLSTEMANEITSMQNESDKPFDQELEGLAISPNMSDLNSLWDY